MCRHGAVITDIRLFLVVTSAVVKRAALFSQALCVLKKDLCHVGAVRDGVVDTRIRLLRPNLQRRFRLVSVRTYHRLPRSGMKKAPRQECL